MATPRLSPAESALLQRNHQTNRFPRPVDNWSSSASWNSSSSQAQCIAASNHPPRSININKANGKVVSASTSSPSPTTAKPIPQRPGRSRSQSDGGSAGLNGAPMQRRGSWFSSISSRFSTSPANGHTSPPPVSTPNTDDVAPLPKILPNKNAVLPHASRHNGDAPYIPAPPKTTQQSFLGGMLRRLSSSNGPISPGARASHGLVERKVLNIDARRERCRVKELSPAKLRRVAFCVDVEIAPMPKYADEEAPACKKPADTAEKQKVAGKSEGEALKNPKAAEQEKESAGVVKATGEAPPKDAEKEGVDVAKGNSGEKDSVEEKKGEEVSKTEKETTRKKEKKKKNEAERKAKKEQKRREALEKGAIPMELHYDTDSSSEEYSSRPGFTRTHYVPTTNPVRIYRRCCQLRETDILTKVTHQLPKSTESCANGIVEKLDLSGYFMSLPDLITLGDFLAVVPIKEVILEDCGLTDEGFRVVLAGLLAARRANVRQRRKSVTRPDDLIQHGGVVERLVLKNNGKIGAAGWKHICLFIHMCRSIKFLDLSSLPFPVPVESPKTPLSLHLHHSNGQSAAAPIDLSVLLSKSIAERLAGSELELLNISSIGLNMNQLGTILDGVLKSGVIRLGLAHNNLDAQGVQHVAKYLRVAKCEGIDLGGNDLRDQLQEIAEALDESHGLWAIGLAKCNLKPASLCKLLPTLTKLRDFKFLDLSHNRELFESEPSAIGQLRKYLPQMANLRRLHLADVSLSSEQVIALAEILPEVKTLAHINLLENPSLTRLANAKTEESKEEACALYASLLAAARVSSALIKVDIDIPSAESGEIVKALADRLVVYCMRNLQGVADIRDSAGDDGQKSDKLPNVLRHLVGHEDDLEDEDEDDSDPAPNEDYVIGGTGVVKALACVLKNREDTKQESDGSTQDLEDVAATSKPDFAPEKARGMSKHLLSSARKIRARLQPALALAKASSSEDIHNYHRLTFLDQTIEGIIKRFEDEFPDTRETSIGAAVQGRAASTPPELGTSLSSSLDADPSLLSDTEDMETEVRPGSSRSRSNSIISHTSKALAEEEGRALRVGHRFRRGLIKQEHYDLLMSPEEIGNDPNHLKVITSMMDEIMGGDEQIKKDIQEKGPIRAFQEHREDIIKRLREEDLQYWEKFVESQEKARANVQVGANPAKVEAQEEADEEAISD
ncbi:RNI-like protein [Durotheca rogersii]|uniref:RNI-like protein n=1 Tax=Durotheca rogersii TaxID=419775 RepID=UPI002220BB33|nr:RNI-like protein [Durotheca rogersii]KAI5860077.1 RNI-like protein [Durotheca rogersii]